MILRPSAPEVFGNAAHSESLEQELRIRLLRNGASHSALRGTQHRHRPVTPVASMRRRRSDDDAGEQESKCGRQQAERAEGMQDERLQV